MFDRILRTEHSNDYATILTIESYGALGFQDKIQREHPTPVHRQNN